MLSTRIRTNGNLFQTRKQARAGPLQLRKTTAVEAVTYVCQFGPLSSSLMPFSRLCTLSVHIALEGVPLVAGRARKRRSR